MPILLTSTLFTPEFLDVQQQDRFSRLPLWIWILGAAVIVIVVGIIITLKEEEESGKSQPIREKSRPEVDPRPRPEASQASQEVAAVTPPAPETPVPKPDNLKRIKGIGPKIEKLLQQNGIITFAQLAQIEVSQLQALLDEAGWDNIADPSTWPEQARQLAQ